MKSHFKKFLIIIPGILLLSSCASRNLYKGTVVNIERGKDGHTAMLRNDKGEIFDALLSIPKMEAGYRLLIIGEQVKLAGDTIHINKKVRVLVKKIR